MALTNLNALLKQFSTPGDSQMMATGFNWKATGFYILTLLLALIIVLILVHLFITPIFKTKIGSKGYISLPTQQEGYLTWESYSQDIMDMSITPIAGQSTNYSVAMDILIDNPVDTSKKYRTLFVYAKSLAAPSSVEFATGIRKQIDKFNLAIYIDKDNNDLCISVMDKNNNPKHIQIKNATVREVFRLAVVVTDTYMDAYIDGRLAGTITYPMPPSADDARYIFAPSSSTIKARNLLIFNRALVPAEVKDIRTGYAKFDISKIADSVTCSSVTDMTSSFVSNLPSVNNFIGSE